MRNLNLVKLDKKSFLLETGKGLSEASLVEGKEVSK